MTDAPSPNVTFVRRHLNGTLPPMTVMQSAKIAAIAVKKSQWQSANIAPKAQAIVPDFASKAKLNVCNVPPFALLSRKFEN